MDLLHVAVTSLVSLAAIFLLTKLMGNKQVSQMNLFDYVIGITIGSIAAEMATELDTPENSLLAMAVYAVAAVCIALYWPLAPQIMRTFIHDEQTVALGTVYLRARCFAPIMMFLCFHMVHYMQALGKGGVSLALAAIRQLGMNIPLLFLLDHFFGMTGIIWTQVTADALTAAISYLIYVHVKRGLEVPDGTKTGST